MATVHVGVKGPVTIFSRCLKLVSTERPIEEEGNPLVDVMYGDG